jgi:predicted MPP superfamily phosphohydrolase
MIFIDELAGGICIYVFALVLTIAIVGVFFNKYREKPSIYIAALAIYAMVAVACPLFLTQGLFQLANLYAYGIFLGGPAILGIAAYFAYLGKLKNTSLLMLLMALSVVAIGVDAFVVEPHLLESTHMTVTSSKVKRPITVAVVSDLQTDHVNGYDQNALESVLKEKPDLILMPGDYVQCLNSEQQSLEMAKFRDLLKTLKFSAPMGVYAVRGNSEGDDWPLEFTGTGVHAAENTTLYELPDLDITGLSFQDSFNSHLNAQNDDAVKDVPPGKFHIIFGHGPDFALAHPPADLLIAGHTHGGQVRLPFIGPLITLSKVPRAWAAGKNKIDKDTTLIVSRGIGMERQCAPRLRFLCRPQIIFVTIVPENK